MANSRKGRSRNRRHLLLPFLLFLFLHSAAAAEIPCAWTGVERMVAVADLHGDYDRFIFILTNPKVGILDENLRWAAGKAHLVQLGDVMDRGPEAKRIFDLLIRLEKEAVAAGGMVHVLLGNHEEMNITGIALGYPRYVTVKQFYSFLPDEFRKARDAEYLKTLSSQEKKRVKEEGLDLDTDENFAAFWQQFIDNKDPDAFRAYVVGFNDPYGDWLVKKNIVIKINDVIFTHGGVSEPLSKWPLLEINALMRSELEFFQGRMRNPQLYRKSFKPKLVYDPNSPLWFRGLAKDSPDSAEAEIDRILANLGAQAIVVGHTPLNSNSSSPFVARDNVSRFREKVWIMDTGISADFYGGVPSALIYDNGVFEVWGETEEVAAQSAVRAPEPEDFTSKELENFLRSAHAKVQKTEAAGRTAPWRVTLEADGTVRQAIFKYIDRRRPNDLPDSYKYELAAYALDKYLRLGFVPPVVERQIDKVPGSLQAFVENAIRETDRKEQKISPKDPADFLKKMADLRVFENLAYDDCRNERDVWISREDGKIRKVDFSEAFAPKIDTFPRCDIQRCSRSLYKKLLAWDDKAVADLMRPYLNEDEVRALNSRRDLILRFIEKLIQVRGEPNVLY